MFKIRDDHRAAFDRAARESYERRAVPLLREWAPEATRGLGDEAIAAELWSLEPEAAAHGLGSEYGLACFAFATLLLGEGWSSDPACLPARIVLNSPALGPAAKATALASFAETMAQSSGAARRGTEG